MRGPSPVLEEDVKFPKLFGKKKDDDEDEDDDFEIDAVDLDDVSDLDVDEDDLVGGPQVPSGPQEHHEDDDEDEGDVDVEDDEEMVGGDDELKNPFDGVEDDEDLDDDELDDEEDDDGSSAKRKAILFAAVGAGVLLLSALGGVGWWLLSGPSEPAPHAAAENTPGRVELAMPAPPGSLNAAGNGASLNDLSASGATTAGGTAQAPGAEPSAPATIDSVSNAASSAETLAAEPVSPVGGLNAMSSLNGLDGAQAGGGLVIPAVAAGSMSRIPDQPSAADQSQSLANAPVKALLEELDGVGSLPKIGPNGVVSWQVYARPIDPALTLPKIAIIIEGIGLSRQASLGAINKLPPEISMALSPYGRDLNDWVFRSRLAGHEVFMLLPMESDDFPMEDAGPLALDTRVQLVENQRRMNAVMAAAGGYVGLVTMMGSRFMKADGQLRTVFKTINDRGLMFVIGGNKTRNDAAAIAQELKVVRAESDMYIDDIPRIQQIRTNLDRAESLARDRGTMLVMARPYPVTIKSILDWIATLKDKGIALVPASATAVIPAAAQ